MNYLEIIIDFTEKEPWNEIAVSEFSNLSFTGFDLSGNVFRAYVNEAENQHEEVLKLIEKFKRKTSLKYELNVLEHKNWNEVWESSFEPISIRDEFFILAPFHEKPKEGEKYILIEPKMSFGTGHHQTTFMISKYLLDEYANNPHTVNKKKGPILDMGAGTGVLSIIAEKFKFESIIAIENEKGSFDNLEENVKLNNCKNIQPIFGSFSAIPRKKYSLILANINKSTLLHNFSHFKENAQIGTKLVLSGFLNSDAKEMIECAAKFGFELDSKESKDEWLMLVFKRM